MAASFRERRTVFIGDHPLTGSLNRGRLALAVSVETSDGRTVGRELELATIDGALDALAAGTSGCVAVEGEAGIGKTRLLAELRERAERRGCLVLSGAAAEFERDLPFAVWADALDAYAASQALDLAPDLLEELAEVLPSLAPADADTRDAIADERYRAHRAVRRLLAPLAGGRPLVLVLDDLHWSDDASIELLAALLRRGADVPTLLAIAFRPGRAAQRLAPALAVRTVRRLRPPPLTEGEAAELLVGVAPGAAAEIYRHGGGNPFYLEQLARTPGARLGAAADGNGGVPPAVAASLAEELAALSETERRMLDGAAVAGEPFEPDLAAAIAELSEAAGLEALDGLLALDLVRATAVPRRFAFRHPLLRRAVYETIPGGRRLAAHGRAADALAALGAPAAERARHVEQSARPCDEVAIELLLEAAARTAPRAPATAAHWFEAALRLLPSDDREARIDVMAELARSQQSLGELERCRSTLLEALALVPADAGADAHRIELTARCAAVEHWLGRHGEAHARLVRAWERLPRREGPEAAALQIELAIDGLYELDLDNAVAMGRGALTAARATGDDVLVAGAASALCLCEVASGLIEAARTTYVVAVRLVDGLPDERLAPRLESLYYLGWADNYLEHYDAAIAHVDRGSAIARGTREGRLLVPMMLVKGYTHEMRGTLDEAVETCEAAVEATRLSASAHDLAWALNELAYARYHTGELDAAIAAAEESVRVGGKLAGATIPAGGGGPGWALGMSLFEAGEVERGWAIMRELGEDDLAHKIPVERCFDWEVLALAQLALGHPHRADEFARRTEEHAAALGLRLPAAIALRTRAAVEHAAGEHEAAARHYQEAAALARSIGARLPAAFALGTAGQALAAAGDRTGAIALLREAERELDEFGSLRVRDELRRELRKLGARAEVRGPSAADDSGVGALTKREREIADLVTDRRTNKEIAATLFLSEKTVESHLRNIFIKLGAGSRVEVARAIERERREREPA
jgi:DNA-binding CsgD family transcriptional regulator